LSGNAAGAQIAYISDDVGVFLHRGPSNQFKLVGTVPAGSRVTLVDRNEMTGYVKIVDGEGKSGWVEKRFVSTEISRRERLASVERELEQLKKQFKGSASKLAAYQSELSQLKHQNKRSTTRPSYGAARSCGSKTNWPARTNKIRPNGFRSAHWCLLRLGIAGSALGETPPP